MANSVAIIGNDHSGLIGANTGLFLVYYYGGEELFNKSCY